MFNRQAILIVGSNFYNGFDLAAAVEGLDGIVIGPIEHYGCSPRLAG